MANMDDDVFTNIVNSHSDSVRQMAENAYQNSTRVSRQEYDKKKAKCSSNFKYKALSTILAVSLAAGITIGGIKTVKNFNNSTRNLNTFEKINLSKPLKNGYFFVKFRILLLHTLSYVGIIMYVR